MISEIISIAAIWIVVFAAIKGVCFFGKKVIK
jgi:hypothetical protein